MKERKSDFELYVEKYCSKHRIAPDVAKTHYLVRDVKSYYDEQETANKGKIQAQEGGCDGDKKV